MMRLAIAVPIAPLTGAKTVWRPITLSVLKTLGRALPPAERNPPTISR